MILWLSLAACLLVSMYLPVLGQQVLKRRIIFVDLALAQVAAMGYAIGLATEGSGMLYAAIIPAACRRANDDAAFWQHVGSG